MNLIDKNKYYEFSNILSGCRTILDAYYFAEKYSKNNPETKNLVSSMINGKKYEKNVLDLKTMRSLIEMLDNIKYRDEAEKLISEYSEMTTDKIQLKTLSRISKSKILRPVIENIQLSEISKPSVENIIKNCPHCFKECIAPIDTEYTICGYTNSKTGYDLVGCGKDWCFKCGKMLCKKWDIHQLFLATNKHHDSECCKNHAKEHSKSYPENYCQCCNFNVTR